MTKLKTKVWRKAKGEFEKHELVSTHICRRSFATNHYGKLPTPVIMAITGHTTEKMFLNYIGKTAKDNANALQNFWKVQEQKRKKKTRLELIKKKPNSMTNQETEEFQNKLRKETEINKKIIDVLSENIISMTKFNALAEINDFSNPIVQTKLNVLQKKIDNSNKKYFDLKLDLELFLNGIC